jgi:HSP20 family protein
MLRSWYDPYSAEERPIYHYMDQLFIDLFNEPKSSWPNVILDNNENEFMFYVDVPGMSEKDIKVSIHQGNLIIEGKRKTEIPDGYRMRNQERFFNEFLRSYSLPNEIDVEKISAKIGDGVLTVKMPVAQKDQTKQITVDSV